MSAAEKSKDELARLARCSPGYRAAVMGERELPAKRTRGGVVQFAAYAVSIRAEGGQCILRATLDEGQAIELRLPKGIAAALAEATPSAMAATF